MVIMDDDNNVKESDAKLEEQRETENKKNPAANYSVFGMCIGMCLGSALGIAFGNFINGLILGMCSGVLVGGLFGVFIKKKK